MKIIKPLDLFNRLQKLTASNRGPLLGLDVGKTHIGVALSDEALKIADPLRVINRADQDAATELEKLVSDYSLSGFIIGKPMYKLQPAKRTGMVETFVTEMGDTGKFAQMHTCFWNEVGTSKSAMLMLKGLGLDKADEKAMNDMLAAVGILQGYLDFFHSDKSKSQPWKGEIDANQSFESESE